MTTRNERGFRQGDERVLAYGDTARVYESSAASSPHLWLKLVSGPAVNPEQEIIVHLNMDDVEWLVGELRDAQAQHYQRVR